MKLLYKGLIQKICLDLSRGKKQLMSLSGVGSRQIEKKRIKKLMLSKAFLLGCGENSHIRHNSYQ